MTFRHIRTDDPNNTATESRTRFLEKLLARQAAEGVDVIELRRQMGKNGYVPTEHRWEDDGEDEDLTDGDGTVLLIGGVSPGELAADIVEAARQHVEDAGERKNYRVVGLRRVEGDEGEDEEEAFRFLLPATLFEGYADPSSASESSESHDALMAANQQLQRQNDLLFRVLMDVVRQYPQVLTKVTALMEQLGDQLGGGRQHDLQQVLSILEFESSREQRWMDHDRAKQRSDHRADMLGKSIDLAGPGVVVLLQRILEMVAQQKADGSTDGEGGAKGRDAASSNASGRTSAQSASKPKSKWATRLDTSLSKVSKDGIAKARLLLFEDEWELIERARSAADDDEFAAIFTKLNESWGLRNEEEADALMRGLVDALGIESAMNLARLIKEVQNH